LPRDLGDDAFAPAFDQEMLAESFGAHRG
jgi:hypothetical protein